MIGEHTIYFSLGHLLGVSKPVAARKFSLLPALGQLVADAVPSLRSRVPTLWLR